MDSFQETLKSAFAACNDGRHAEAEAICRVLVRLNPREAQLLFLLGMVLHKTRRDEEAVAWLRQAADLQPEAARIFNGLGCAYHSLKNYPLAFENFARAIKLSPCEPDLYYSAGNACHQTGEFEKAVSFYKKGVELNPKDSAIWNNLGKSFHELNQLEESIAAYQRAIEVKPDYALAHYGKALSLLASGRLEEGFHEYEWRSHKLPPRQFSQPRWQGEVIPTETLFLHAEQGFGDAILSVRFVRRARERAARIVLECRPELKTLFVFSSCADQVIAYGEPVPPFDYFASLISLPGILGVKMETIPHHTPYLKAPSLENFPDATGKNLKVGIVWAGNPGHHDDGSRSIRLTELAPIFQIPHVTFYNLQMPLPERDEPFFRSLANVADSARFKDFLETAATVMKMDLIISVDTAVAHLAGALGKTVWTLIQFSPDWRWFLDRPNTIWYPTMRLFRQKTRNQWQPVIAQAAEELHRLASERKTPAP